MSWGRSWREISRTEGNPIGKAGIRFVDRIKSLHLFDLYIFSYLISASLRGTWLETGWLPCHNNTSQHHHHTLTIFISLDLINILTSFSSLCWRASFDLHPCFLSIILSIILILNLILTLKIFLNSQNLHHSRIPYLILLSLLTSFLAFSTLKPLLVRPFSTTAVLKGSANRNATWCGMHPSKIRHKTHVGLEIVIRLKLFVNWLTPMAS